MAALLDKGYAVTRVTRGQPGVRWEDDHTLLVLGAFEEGPPAIEDGAGGVGVEARDIAGLDAAGVLEMVESVRAAGRRPMNQPGAWKPWFPVIDYDRCTNCMQCLSFCLFDVYGVSPEGKIQVQNNDNCKTNCPACSRVCPEVAIMFPKYSHGPINGDVVQSEDVRREKMKVDITSLLGGDIYSRLRDRSVAAKSRFSKERSPDKALEERKKCLTKLADDGFIPAEVLANLPSPEEIQRRAVEAASKARAAVAGSGATG
jgi:Pyruvate/2-oxoacid:ferredoxin oxidoreductase delta subunit